MHLPHRLRMPTAAVEAAVLQDGAAGLGDVCIQLLAVGPSVRDVWVRVAARGVRHIRVDAPRHHLVHAALQRGRTAHRHWQGMASRLLRNMPCCLRRHPHSIMCGDRALLWYHNDQTRSMRKSDVIRESHHGHIRQHLNLGKRGDVAVVEAEGVAHGNGMRAPVRYSAHRISAELPANVNIRSAWRLAGNAVTGACPLVQWVAFPSSWCTTHGVQGSQV